MRVVIYKLTDPQEKEVIHLRNDARLRTILAPFLHAAPPQEAYLDAVFEPGCHPQTLHPLPPGTYLMVVRSVNENWCRVRVLVVTELELTARTFPDGFALLATLRGRPAAGVELHRVGDQGRGRTVRLGTTDAQGFLALPFPRHSVGSEMQIVATIRTRNIEDAEHRNCIRLHVPTPLAKTTQLKSHIFFDRSIYRPGETIRGRLVARRYDGVELPGLWTSQTDSAPLASPFADREVVVEVQVPEGPGRQV
ncbi:MAG: hypothetical protein AB1486_03600 [Planctomycetota bacterium]